MKKSLLALIIILIIVFGFLIGKYIYKISTIEDINIAETELVEDECTLEYEQLEETKNANSTEEKVSPNAKITTITYYDTCGHSVTKTEEAKIEYINLSKDELKKKYDNCEIRKFTPELITFYKEAEGICDEHYVLREKDGVIAVFALDENGTEILRYTTETGVQFLPLTDLEKLKGGIKVFGKDNLNSVLEDYE